MGIEGSESNRIEHASHSWIYATAPVEFEVRRAVAHLARADGSANTREESTDASDVLAYISSCKEVLASAAVLLKKLVGDARREGTGWASIGKAIGVGETAAQKRFRQLGNLDTTFTESEIEAARAVAVFNHAGELDSAGRLGEDDEGLKPEEFFRSGIHKLARAAVGFHETIYLPYAEHRRRESSFHMPEEWWIRLAKSGKRLNDGLLTLVNSGAIGLIFQKSEFFPAKPYVDQNPGLYFSYACFHGTMASGYLSGLADALTQDMDRFHENFEVTAGHHQAILDLIGRPECLATMQVINWSLDNRGRKDPNLSPEIHHGFVLLQAALAEAVMDDVRLADRRADALSELDPAALAVLVRVASDYICRMSTWSGADWTTAADERGEPTNIEDRSPAPRVWSRRMMAAWSTQDFDTFDALLTAATAADRDQRQEFTRDLFGLLIDQAVTHGRRVDNPYIIVMQLTRSIRRIGLDRTD